MPAGTDCRDYATKYHVPRPAPCRTLFYKQVTLRRGLPFAVKIPNLETREAMRQALEGEDLTEWSDLEALERAHG